MDVCFSSFFLSGPTRHEPVRNPKMIEDAGDDGVHHLLDILRAGVERRIGRENRRAGLEKQLEVLDVDQVERGFAGNQDELPPFLQGDVGRAEQHVFAIAMGDPAQRAHAARDDDHGVGSIGAAGEWGVHALEIVRDRAGRQPQAAGQFLRDDCRGILTEYDVDLVLAGIEVVEQPLGIKRAAGSGDGDKYSQQLWMVDM